jgi:uncharacterized protein (TIGR03067 family)
MMPAVLALAVTLAAPAAKEAPKKDPPSLVGEWAAETAVIGGKLDNPPPGTTWTFTADGKSVLQVGGGQAAAGSDAKYTTDAKKDPAQVDVSEGPKGKSMKGIYKVEGDTLTLCLVQDGDDRPTAFESPAGSKAILITLKKVKKKD